MQANRMFHCRLMGLQEAASCTEDESCDWALGAATCINRPARKLHEHVHPVT